MARPGFVLDVDDRTPPVLVASGDTFRLERLPVGARVVYPADSLPSVHRRRSDRRRPGPPHRLRSAGSAAATRDAADDHLRRQHRAGAADDARPTCAATIIEAVLTRAAAAGVDDVALIAAIGLNRRQTPAELRALVGERVFRSFHADGLLTNHDAEDPEELAELGSGRRAGGRGEPAGGRPPTWSSTCTW